MYTFLTLAQALGVKPVRCDFPDLEIAHLITDTRRPGNISEGIFFAHKGAHHDGHKFIHDAYKAGVRSFLIEQEVGYQFDEGVNLIQYENAIAALQKIAAFHRGNFSLPITAITGSNGKTIVKEWLSTLVSTHHSVAKSPHSYNSRIGVPISIWSIGPEHKEGIFEAGISKSGEMGSLQKIIEPDYGIFTNIGTAHNEGFSNIEEKAQEKARLFTNCKWVIYCKDHRTVDHSLRNIRQEKKISWGVHPQALIKTSVKRKDDGPTTLELSLPDGLWKLEVPFNDQASLENIMHCIVWMWARGYTVDQIQAGINDLRTIPMRLEIKRGINQCYLIDDTYNNDLGGLEVALDFLEQQKQPLEKTVILSDILQSGLPDQTLYEQVGDLLESRGISRLIGIGKGISNQKDRFNQKVSFYPSTEVFLEKMEDESFHKEYILIKGARNFEFERIVKRIQEKTHDTVLEISLSALVYNLNYYRALLKPDTKIMVMVKAFAYGSGLVEVAQWLEFHKTDYLAVAYTDEGVTLRNSGIKTPIMVMNPTEDSLDDLVRHHLEPEVYSIDHLNKLLKISIDQDLSIHLKLDTGMNRLGLSGQDLEVLIPILKKNPQVRVKSVFSHLAAADMPEESAFTHAQADEFMQIVNRLQGAIGYQPMRHILNSPGIVNYPDYQFEMVRLGIGLYGIDPANIHTQKLQPVSTLKSTISQIRLVPGGSSVGYSRKGKADEARKIATIAIGYADGLRRALGNGKFEVVVNGKKAPIVGNVCMDMTMIDVTDIPATVGDTVIIFGLEPRVETVAESMDSIPYEVLAGIGERVKRVFYYD